MLTLKGYMYTVVCTIWTFKNSRGTIQNIKKRQNLRISKCNCWSEWKLVKLAKACFRADIFLYLRWERTYLQYCSISLKMNTKCWLFHLFFNMTKGFERVVVRALQCHLSWLKLRSPIAFLHPAPSPVRTVPILLNWICCLKCVLYVHWRRHRSRGAYKTGRPSSGSSQFPRGAQGFHTSQLGVSKRKKKRKERGKFQDLFSWRGRKEEKK